MSLPLMTLGPNDHFEVGGEDLLAPIRTGPGTTEHESQNEATQLRQREIIDDIQVRIGTLLKTETVSFLLGAGASVECGGQLIGSVPLVVERHMQSEGITNMHLPRIRGWLKIFYLAVKRAGCDNVSLTRDAILQRRDNFNDNQPESLKVNFEQVLAILYRWRSALPDSGGRLRVSGSPPLDTKGGDLDACLRQATYALAQACILPTSGNERALVIFKTFIRKLLTRPLNLKRANIFTLNYDTLVEQASDSEGVVLLDGFVGTQHRVFRPESYEQDLYFPAETTEGRVHRFDRVLHLYKLHGSITWVADEPTIDNPYGLLSRSFDPTEDHHVLIYPTPSKYGETLGMPYAELFRRFATALVRPQSVLFVIGYGFGDEHVNAIISQALSVPSFTLVIVDPMPRSEFVVKLREQMDRRVWIVQGDTIGKLSGFVEYVLPDLRDEEIRKKVLDTHRALTKTNHLKGKEVDGD